MQAKAQRRHRGRLRSLTNDERARRQERRERLNPEREARKRNMRGRLIFEPTPPRKLAPDWFARSAVRLGR